MSTDPVDLTAGLNELRPKAKDPTSARVLDTWIAQAERQIGASSEGGRLGWLVASTVVTAALQRAADEDGNSRFLLKGGTLLQHRLGLAARTTRDLDGLVRGDIDTFLAQLDEALRLPWGPLTMRRSEIEVIATPTRVIKPRRFTVFVELRGATWRRIQVEISPDEGSAGATPEFVTAPTLRGFGLPSPELLASLALNYQIAQKIHAATDPHDPPVAVNDRARDVTDLLLLKSLTETSGIPRLADVRAAVHDVFAARAADAAQLDLVPRTWPATLTAFPHWATDYATAATSAGVDVPLEDAVATINAWLDEIEQTTTS
ncbi:nucleotidyl transferase AbiEii/AbiGii toxin family protein [Isoptericola sp. G70]|uniref:nucleotidyl transferase AbiEii/AbiGii toxin family protein n=1 Tax=Isoptericola sp. G70 TaxID=3376633 RepID=UPI003A80D5D5